jgi:hypothetical protein
MCFFVVVAAVNILIFSRHSFPIVNLLRFCLLSNCKIIPDQGCQISHEAIYKNGEKYTKLPLNYQGTVNYTKYT